MEVNNFDVALSTNKDFRDKFYQRKFTKLVQTYMWGYDRSL